MQHRNRFFTVFKIAGLVGALCPILALGAPQSPPSAPVTVVNQAANPVPVTGSLTITNTNVPVIVNNTDASPIPVSVVSVAPPAPEPTVTCKIDTGSALQNSPFASNIISFPGDSISCPSTIAAIDVQRLLFVPDPGHFGEFDTTTASYRSAFGTQSATDEFALGNVIALVTEGSPEKVFSPSVRLGLAKTDLYVVRTHCTSGLAGINVTCGGILYFIGTPAL
jgi:hypothetical protein